jgi:RimK family alpha-L-glutamate ligase
MKLVVVYGLKTMDYRYLKEFYPARRLSDECKKRSIPLRFLFPPDVPAFLSEYASNAEKKNTICLIRGSVDPGTVSLLENRGFRTVNSSQSLALANDKLETARFLEKHRWPTPKTRIAEKTAAGYPLVAKPRYGSRGMGVQLVSNAENLMAIPPEYIFQEYIAPSHGRDLRFFFAGKEVLAVALRYSRDGAFVSNSCVGGVMSVPGYSEEILRPWKAMTIDIARKAGLWYGTVDYLFLETGQDGGDKPLSLTVCELNAAPGFEALEKDCGIDIAGALIERLGEFTFLPTTA